MNQSALRASKLTRTYLSGKHPVHALRGIDLLLEPGQFVVLLGPSGAGKTTTLNLLGCLDRPSGGQLWLADTAVFGNGKPLGEARLDALRREHIGFVFTDFLLLPTLSAVENVQMPLIWTGKRTRGQAVELLEAVGLGHRLDHRPAELSGGEMQRVAIARALVNEPRVLLADEPTGNLDTTTRDEILDLLHKLTADRGLAVLLATHDRELTTRADQVIHIRDGRIEGGAEHEQQ